MMVLMIGEAASDPNYFRVTGWSSLAQRWGGETPRYLFLDSSKTNADIATKLCILLPLSILHILTKGFSEDRTSLPEICQSDVMFSNDFGQQ